MIHDTVNELRGMLQTYTDGQPFGFDKNVRTVEHAVDVAGRMAGGQDDGTLPFSSIGADDSSHACAALYEQVVYTGVEVYFSSALQNGAAHLFNHAR